MPSRIQIGANLRIMSVWTFSSRADDKLTFWDWARVKSKVRRHDCQVGLSGSIILIVQMKNRSKQGKSVFPARMRKPQARRGKALFR
jgi:hypothetical protein